jgi:hypothetical protein
MLVLTQVHIQTGRERATDDAVGDFQVDRSGVVAGRHHLAREDVGLYRAGLVNQEHPRFVRQCHGGHRRLGRLGALALPLTQMLFKQGHDFRQARIAGDYQGGAFRTEVGVLVGNQVVTGQRRDIGFGAGSTERNRIGMAFTVHERWQDTCGCRVRADFFLFDGGQPLGADTLDFLGIEARLAQHLREQGDGWIQFFLDGRQ